MSEDITVETTAEQAKEVSAPINTDITIGEKKYVLTDFQNTWTIRQNKAAADVIAAGLKSLFNGGETVDINNPVAVSQIMGALVASEMDIDLLAVIYLDEGESNFSTATYRARKQAFKEQGGDIQQRIATEALTRFFGSGALSVKTAFQTFSAMM